MFGVKPVITIGFDVVAVPTVPVVPLVGAGEPQGTAKYSKLVAELLFVNAKIPEFEVIADVDNAVGFGHVGGGAQVTLATQPLETTLLSVVKTKVKQPPGTVEVIIPGEFVPEKVPIKGDAELFPL